VLASTAGPFRLSLAAAAALSAAVGAVVGLPALRVKGIYLGIATLAFGFIVEEVLARWESVTGGNAGKAVGSVQMFGWTADGGTSFYFVCLVITVLCTLAVLNLLRSPTGRAFVAIRDSEISAQSMGIHLAYYKTLSFAISAALAGIGGALYAHMIRFLSPRAVQHHPVDRPAADGGHRRPGQRARRLPGRAFLIGMPQAIAAFKDLLPDVIGQAPGLKSVIYGAVLILFVLFEPLGLYGRWLKVRTWFQLFPFYRKGCSSGRRPSRSRID
jgi:branched-chain amino acid transport system permease protein